MFDKPNIIPIYSAPLRSVLILMLNSILTNSARATGPWAAAHAA